MTRHFIPRSSLIVLIVWLAAAASAHAQTSSLAANSTASSTQAPAASDPPAAAATTAQEDDPDLDPSDTQPDFTLTTLPTNLRLPRHKLAFRLTHRFNRPLGAGSFGNLAGDLFGLDAGALVGLDFRFGLIRGGQIGVYRTSNKTIQFYGQYEVKSQRTFPLGVSVFASIDGANNFRDIYSPGVMLVLSREVSDRAAFYLEPAWVNNTNPNLPGQPDENDDDDTVLVGLGARLRLLRNTYLVVEGSPRVAGYSPGEALISFGIERRAGGHNFQLNVSNGFGSTLAQVARGVSSSNDWYLGFNLSRKFF